MAYSDFHFTIDAQQSQRIQQLLREAGIKVQTRTETSSGKTTYVLLVPENQHGRAIEIYQDFTDPAGVPARQEQRRRAGLLHARRQRATAIYLVALGLGLGVGILCMLFLSTHTVYDDVQGIFLAFAGLLLSGIGLLVASIVYFLSAGSDKA